MVLFLPHLSVLCFVCVSLFLKGSNCTVKYCLLGRGAGVSASTLRRNALPPSSVSGGGESKVVTVLN
jgi:hypothetical protein